MTIDRDARDVVVVATRARTRRDADGVDVLHHNLVVRAAARAGFIAGGAG